MACWDKISITVHDIKQWNEPVYTVAEFSRQTKLSVQTLNRMDRNGRFKSLRIKYNNRTYRYYTESMLISFLSSDLYHNLPPIKNQDLIGKRFGKLLVLGFSDSAVQKGYFASYKCKCDCGNILDLPRSELLSGKHLSCGCRYKDLTGQTFGYWHVDSVAESLIEPSGAKVMRYHCTCKCGTKRVIIGRSLTSGRSVSCGCFRDESAISKYELCVEQYLIKHGFTKGLGDGKDVGYVQHKSYDDLTGVGGHLLSYDFYVCSQHKMWLIECQGGQHYFPVELWGGDEAFQKQCEHDDRKRKYADNHHIPLIEIPYTMFKYDDISGYLDTFNISINN